MGVVENNKNRNLQQSEPSSVLFPFGGSWDVRIKERNIDKRINLLAPATLAAIVGSDQPAAQDVFLQGLEIQLEFKGQRFDFAIAGNRANQLRRGMHFYWRNYELQKNWALLQKLEAEGKNDNGETYQIRNNFYINI